MNIAELRYFTEGQNRDQQDIIIDNVLRAGGLLGEGEKYKDIAPEELDRRFRKVAVYLNRINLKPKIYWQSKIQEVLSSSNQE